MCKNLHDTLARRQTLRTALQLVQDDSTTMAGAYAERWLFDLRSLGDTATANELESMRVHPTAARNRPVVKARDSVSAQNPRVRPNPAPQRQRSRFEVSRALYLALNGNSSDRVLAALADALLIDDTVDAFRRALFTQIAVAVGVDPAQRVWRGSRWLPWSPAPRQTMARD